MLTLDAVRSRQGRFAIRCASDYWTGLGDSDRQKAGPDHFVYQAVNAVIRETKRAENGLRFDAIISTGSEDRQGDVLVPSGCDVANMLKTAPLLFNHNYMMVAGTILDAMVTDAAVLGSFRIVPTALGEDIAMLIEQGALKSMSHGFDPKEWEPRKDVHGNAMAGWLIRRYEMLEPSVVSVPANVGAVITSVQKGKLHDANLIRWAEKIAEAEAASKAAAPVLIALPTPDEARSDKQESDAFKIQTLIFPKKHWSMAEAKKWCSDHGFKNGVDETEDSYRMRQRDPDDFARLRTICMEPADTKPGDEACKVKAVGGPLKTFQAIEAWVKRGRVLSAANEEKLTEAVEICHELMAEEMTRPQKLMVQEVARLLTSVLEQLHEEEEERSKSASPPLADDLLCGLMDMVK